MFSYFCRSIQFLSLNFDPKIYLKKELNTYTKNLKVGQRTTVKSDKDFCS